MLGFLLVAVAMLLLLGFMLEMVFKLQGGSRELVGTGQLFSLLCFICHKNQFGLVLGMDCELVARGSGRSFHQNYQLVQQCFHRLQFEKVS